jgi:hypothetical protein
MDYWGIATINEAMIKQARLDLLAFVKELILN